MRPRAQSSRSNVSRETSEAVNRRDRQLLPDAEIAEDYVQHVLHIDPAEKFTQRAGREAQVLGHQLLATVLRRMLGVP